MIYDPKIPTEGPAVPLTRNAAFEQQRKLIQGLAGFAAVETRALLNELEQIHYTASDNGLRNYKPDGQAMHGHRLAAWGNIEKVKDALINLANEIDRMGD